MGFLHLCVLHWFRAGGMEGADWCSPEDFENSSLTVKRVFKTIAMLLHSLDMPEIYDYPSPESLFCNVASLYTPTLTRLPDHITMQLSQNRLLILWGTLVIKSYLVWAGFVHAFLCIFFFNQAQQNQSWFKFSTTKPYWCTWTPVHESLPPCFNHDLITPLQLHYVEVCAHKTLHSRSYTPLHRFLFM